MAKEIYNSSGIIVYELSDGPVRLKLCNFGASIYSVEMKKGDGTWRLITLTRDTPEEFIANGQYFGASCGRTVNRIDKGRFTLGGKQYQLSVNENDNSAHGGFKGWAVSFWNGRISEDGSVIFTLHTDDGNEGYPGAVDAEVRYSLKDGAIRIEHRAVTDADTIINMTNHAYWMLGGAEHQIYDEDLKVNAKEYLELRDDLIPTGQVLSCKGTPFDFSEGMKVGAFINDENRMIRSSRGYDVSFVRADREPGTAAVLSDPDTGIRLTVSSSYPDIHLYSGNFLDGVTGPEGRVLKRHDALCLEASLFPDAINHPCFGKIVLRKGETYSEFIEYRLEQF